MGPMVTSELASKDLSFVLKAILCDTDYINLHGKKDDTEENVKTALL